MIIVVCDNVIEELIIDRSCIKEREVKTFLLLLFLCSCIGL